MSTSLGTVRDFPKNVGKWRVQVGYKKGAYKDRYTLPSDKPNLAHVYYNGLNTHSGYKKRLVGPDGTIVLRYLS